MAPVNLPWNDISPPVFLTARHGNYSAPTSGQTVKQAWQERRYIGKQPQAGYGTTFTSDLPGALGLGFDFYTPAGGSSIKVYNPATGQFNGISSTNAWSIGNTRGYMLFIRGDRSVNTSAQPAVPVVLRTTGKVYSPGADARRLHFRHGRQAGIRGQSLRLSH